MNTRNQLICTWSGWLCFFLFFFSVLIFAKIFPPHPPSASAEEIEALYQGNTYGIRIGMILFQMAGALLIPFVCAISIQLKRVEGQFDVMSMTQMAGGISVALFIQLPAISFSATAFRPDRGADLLLVMSDLSNFYWIMAIVAATVQCYATGFAILSDERKNPIYPRWAAYVNFWVGTLYLPGCLLTFFKTGPFAWDGLISFYLVATIFSVWFFTMIPATTRAIKRQAAENDSSSLTEVMS